MDNFDLRKFLTENKLTFNSNLISEDGDYADYKPGSIAPADLYYSDKHGKLVAMDDVDDKYHDSLELVYHKGDRIEDIDEEVGDEEELDLVPDLDKGGKNYSDNGYESYKLQVKAGYQIPEPYSLKNYKNAAELNREQAKDEGHRIGKYVVELEGQELEQFVKDWMKAWNEEISGGEKA